MSEGPQRGENLARTDVDATRSHHVEPSDVARARLLRHVTVDTSLQVAITIILRYVLYDDRMGLQLTHNLLLLLLQLAFTLSLTP